MARPIIAGHQRRLGAIAGNDALERWHLLTSLSTTSGQSSETTSIPATTSAIRLVFDGVSLDGSTDEIQVEIGSTSYATVSVGVTGSIATAAAAETAWAGSGPAVVTRGLTSGVAAEGIVELVKHNDHHWGISGNLSNGNVSISLSAGRIELAAAMDRLKITPTGTPTDSFDAGAVHVWIYSFRVQ